MSDYKDKPEHTIPEGSYHPAADDAMQWLKKFMVTDPHRYLMIKEAIYSTALSNNDLANYCVGTIERLAAGEPVSDRYLLGLAWLVRDMAEQPDIQIGTRRITPKDMA